MLAGLAAENGTTILVTTHYLEEADQFADRVAIVDRGRLVVVTGPAPRDRASSASPGTARVLSDPDLRAPSLLPGWTRAHVLAHLARGADAMRHLLVGARSGEERPAYASERQRQADIDRGARATVQDLAADLADSAMAFRSVVRELPDGAWGFRVRILGSAPFPAAELLVRRLAEVELHHCDLGAGYAPGDWPPAFAGRELPEPLRSQRRDRLARAPQG